MIGCTETATTGAQPLGSTARVNPAMAGFNFAARISKRWAALMQKGVCIPNSTHPFIHTPLSSCSLAGLVKNRVPGLMKKRGPRGPASSAKCETEGVCARVPVLRCSSKGRFCARVQIRFDHQTPLSSFIMHAPTSSSCRCSSAPSISAASACKERPAWVTKRRLSAPHCIHRRTMDLAGRRGDGGARGQAEDLGGGGGGGGPGQAVRRSSTSGCR